MILGVFFAIGLALVLSAGTAQAQAPEICTDGLDNDGNKLTDCDDPACADAPNCVLQKSICHNIGGPRDLGANCDMTGTCSYPTEEGVVLTLGTNQFLGIIIPFKDLDSNKFDAHIAHGDGFIVTTYDPPLHTANDGGPHRSSNVECVGTRQNPQPPEPGN
jgi:hypothetical protein